MFLYLNDIFLSLLPKDNLLVIMVYVLENYQYCDPFFEGYKASFLSTTSIYNDFFQDQTKGEDQELRN